MKKTYYIDGLDNATYPSKGKILVSKDGQKIVLGLIDKAKSEGDVDKFKKIIIKYGLDSFAIDQIFGGLDAEVPVEKVVYGMTELMDADNFVCILDETSPEVRYILREKSKSGIDRNYRMLVKTSDNSLSKFVESRNNVRLGRDEKDTWNIPSAIPMFDPKEGALFEMDDNLCINTWTAPELACIPKNASKMVEPKEYNLLRALMLNLVGGDEKALYYMMNVLARSYQNKVSYSSLLVFATVQGVGKGVFEILLNSIFTENHVGHGDKKNNIFTNSDNTMLQDALVYVLDEVPIGGDIYEMAKALVGNQHFPLKVLNNNVIKYPNKALFVNFFNLKRKEEVRFSIDTGDRRISLFHSWTPLIDIPEFKKFEDINDAANLFKVGSDSGIAEYFAWELATMKIDYKLIATPYDNEIRKRWMEAGKDHTEDFYRAILNKDISFFEKFAHGKFTIRDSTKHFIIDTVLKMFDGRFEPRVSKLSEMYKVMFGEDETKETRDQLMHGLKTRIGGNTGDFIYKLPETTRTTTGVEIRIVEEHQQQAISSSLVNCGILGTPPAIPKDFQ